jgi:hypothetical protein
LLDAYLSVGYKSNIIGILQCRSKIIGETITFKKKKQKDPVLFNTKDCNNAKKLFSRLTRTFVQNKLFEKNEQQRHFFLLMTIKQRQNVHLKTFHWNMRELFSTRSLTYKKKKKIEN